jgi:hypothetical protein
VGNGWANNVRETEEEGRRLFSANYCSLRYEDLLAQPFREMQKLWSLLGVQADPALEKNIMDELSSNPDEEWQAKRNEEIASFLPKGQAGNWQRLLTARDKAIFKEVAGELLIKWNYESDSDW